MSNSLSYRGPIASLGAFIKAKMAGMKLTAENPVLTPVYVQKGTTLWIIKSACELIIMGESLPEPRYHHGASHSSLYTFYKTGTLENFGYKVITEAEYQTALSNLKK